VRLRNDERQIDRIGRHNEGPSGHQTGDLTIREIPAGLLSSPRVVGGSSLALPRDDQPS
jgi:hypothetical protein